MIELSGSTNFLSRLVLMSQLFGKKINSQKSKEQLFFEFPIFLPELTSSTNFLFKGVILVGYELVLLAAGQGRRMKASKNKILLHLLGKPVIEYALTTFVNDADCQHIVLVVEKKEKELIEAVLAQNEFAAKVPITVVIGGKERQDSVYNGLQYLKKQTGVVLIHDGARPFLEANLIKKLYQKAQRTNATIVGVPVKDTIKKVVEGKVDQTIPREELWQIQTPQAFQISFIQEVHERARQEGFFGTDDASLVEHYGYAVEVTEGSYMNIKLTTPDDLVIGEAILKMKERGN
ncbi:2-C-methyl-D-erythritol 4-phosphate cytidylyltransferase [Carnobacterium maltaromaticum LMA28]|uniref:2-C-methyl-D-erythritol 4-phosphate cytidylyltransferase n=1 Tax=Carnobacterium maltaromaticum LMA28 TaxID=1234679 RepID=K8E7M0_CARML|nr:2-C-methyl-D-erythritol 4-phosphate cytidylyltransferase [Carnobacterium maltaromaticum]KRN64161.1 2-C-methyl-D-erythritol 4-phosphate cytidylyltransferase [Carnobacterium maltaromaticum DSM 20342]CCO12909.2 2-C-methyl-D-erythritol 4-phosphate cytidylyltransferase [Carnobacterium maltaromaticum LMA28]